MTVMAFLSLYLLEVLFFYIGGICTPLFFLWFLICSIYTFPTSHNTLFFMCKYGHFELSYRSFLCVFCLLFVVILHIFFFFFFALLFQSW
ncbi:hypothetical protein GDO81_025111 [Engystomops pustulosus]|uniref:Uncharacterized protein n=1 Tax=Engystomops pustulosus TaxID=76066 RepID=A0AAV6Z7D7_ENGPU|nr:hypothetical protein GDO81_025111 [Engystomops pustulosus]